MVTCLFATDAIATLRIRDLIVVNVAMGATGKRNSAGLDWPVVDSVQLDWAWAVEVNVAFPILRALNSATALQLEI